MGLFSSKKKTYVNTSVSRLVEDADIKLSNQTAVVEYVLNSSTQVDSNIDNLSLPDQIRTASMNSMPAKMDKFYHWAKGGQYHYGLPKASVVNQNFNALSGILQDILEHQVNGPVTMEYAQIGEPNYYHFTWKILKDTYAYDPTTNELVTLSTWEGHKCYLKDFVIHYSEGTSARVDDDTYFAQWGVAASAGFTPFRAANPKAVHTLYVHDTQTRHDFALVTYCYKDASGNEVTHSVELTYEQYFQSGDEAALPGMGEDANGHVGRIINEDDYVMGACTYAQGGKTHRLYFTYVFGSGVYPSLDNLYSPTETTGQFYPRLYARLGGDNLASRSLKGTAAYKSSVQAGKKLDLTWDEWVNQLHESAGEMGTVQQCFLFLGLAANSSDTLINQYMFRYFSKLYHSSTQPLVVGTSPELRLDYQNYLTKGGQSIVIKDNAFTQVLSYTGIGVRDCLGVVGEVGSYSMERGSILGGRRLLFKTSIGYHAYRYQISANVYREVRVYGLALTEQVSGGHVTVSKGGSENLLVPIDKSMMDDFSAKDIELLYNKGLHVVFNTLQVVKSKWYTSGLFKVVLFIVAVVLSVVTGGQSLTLYTVAMAALQAIVIGLAITALAKLAVKLGVNVRIVAVLAVIAAIYGGYIHLSGTAGMFNASAMSMLRASNAAFSLSTKMSEQELKEIQKDKEDFLTTAKEKDEWLKQKQEALEFSPALVDSSLFLAKPMDSTPYLNLYQSPDDYYTRTVHVGNVGPVSYELLSQYHAQALSLPTPNQTLAFLQGGGT